MNQLKSRERKLIYLVGIIILLIPILLLSQPSDGTKKGANADKTGAGGGGYLYQLRSRYDLGESDLGDVDAAGTAINLVLLGMRGIAVNLLWIEHDELKDMKRWAEMQATTESIVRLQPHYQKVWDMCGWNLAYNTSAEWDAVPDRYYWVKQGAKLLKRGVARNKQATELYYWTGKVLQHKIGIADESYDYRRYFVHDPDPAFKGGADPDINPEGLDNYLVAKSWFTEGCEKEEVRRQHIIDRTLFRSTPARCQFDYAQALQKDGHFGEETRAAWLLARQDWTERFGREIVLAQMGKEESEISLEMTDEDVVNAAKSPDDQVRLRRAIDAYQKICNYRYWRTRAYAEAEPETAEAHRNFFEAKESFKNADFEKARSEAFAGMQKFDKLLSTPEYAVLMDEDFLAEECMLGWKIWDDIHQLAEEKVPEDYPMKWLVDYKLRNLTVMKNVEKQFSRLLREGH